ncbi:hypothetical protein D3C78_1690350 [compost metagenome]
MLGAFGTGINDTDYTTNERYFAKSFDPCFILLRNFQEGNLSVLAAYCSYIDVLAAKHNAFDNGLTTINVGFGLLRQKLHLPSIVISLIISIVSNFQVKF